MRLYFTCALLCAAYLVACGGTDGKTDTGQKDNGEPGTTQPNIVKIERASWYDTYPDDVSGTKTSVAKSEIVLAYSSQNTDFSLQFPDRQHKHAILEYRMGGAGQGPAGYDYTTALRIKYQGEWYELVRVFTPYGGGGESGNETGYGPGFPANWSRTFWFDVTDYLPMLQGEVEFNLYYGGWNNYPTYPRAHTATLTFDLYEGAPDRTMVYAAKMYDSFRNGNSGYKAFSYGVEGYDIEAPERMGERSFTIPSGVKTLEMRLAISGHGHDPGFFPERPFYIIQNAAEFDQNTYKFKINGVTARATRSLLQSCRNNYEQYGNYQYDRANWCPGNPLRVHYWAITDFPTDGTPLKLDIDLEPFISSFSQVNAEGVAQYIVQVDLLGFDK